MPANLALLGKESSPRHYPENKFVVEACCSTSLPMRSPHITGATGRATNAVQFEESSTTSKHVTRATNMTAMTEDPKRPREAKNESDGEELKEKQPCKARLVLLLGTLLVVAAGLILVVVLCLVPVSHTHLTLPLHYSV